MAAALGSAEQMNGELGAVLGCRVRRTKHSLRRSLGRRGVQEGAGEKGETVSSLEGSRGRRVRRVPWRPDGSLREWLVRQCRPPG